MPAAPLISGRLHRPGVDACSGRAARVAGRCRRAPASRQSESSAKLATPSAPARASESERARSRMADPGSVADGSARAGCGSGQAWAPAAARLESSRCGPVCDFACAISDPEPSPQPHREVRRRSFARGSSIARPGSIEAHVIHVGAAIEPPRHLWGAARRSYGPWGLGLRLGPCALPWRVAARFVARLCDKK
jgi:hypothetical protein